MDNLLVAPKQKLLFLLHQSSMVNTLQDLRPHPSRIYTRIVASLILNTKQVTTASESSGMQQQCQIQKTTFQSSLLYPSTQVISAFLSTMFPEL